MGANLSSKNLLENYKQLKKRVSNYLVSQWQNHILKLTIYSLVIVICSGLFYALRLRNP